METVNTNDGRPILIGQVGEFLKHNATELTGTYVPGDSLTIKNGKLYVNNSNILNPYTRGVVEIIAIQEPFVFACINKNSWFTFRTRVSEEGNTVFDSSRTFYPTINDNQVKAYEIFEKLIADDKAALQAKLLKIGLLKSQADAAQLKSYLVIEAKGKRDAALVALKEIVRCKPIAKLMMDSETLELVNEYNFFDTILKAI